MKERDPEIEFELRTTATNEDSFIDLFVMNLVI